MGLDTTTPRSRRALLGAALGAAVASVASAVGRPLPAAAADGEAMLVGHTYDSTMRTQIDSTDYAFLGRSNGQSVAGVHGVHFGDDWGYGVHGINESETGYGVYGTGGEIGTRGVGLTGVEGIGRDTGVRGDGADFGVEGIAHVGGGPDGWGVGVSGTAKTGIGVLATSPSGIALDVVGKARFSRSGRATVAAGRSYVDVDLRTNGGLAGSPLIFATLQSYRSGVFVAATRKNYPSTGKFRIYLNKAVTASTYVAWLVIG
jgi:hypothetical protein